VEGPDDYATMREIVYRRYSRLISDNSDLPQLIIIDGGKGQLNAAVEALQSLGILQNVEIISIAKRLEEIFKPGDSSPLYLNKRSSSLRLIQQIRDEAHRFGISFHRRIRDKKTLSSIFDSISGVGEKSKHKLLRQFGSIESIKVAPVEEIAKIIGESKAVLLKEILNSTYEF
ncbi:MAG: helix-hairpin-helix domain-containing protein, partial [Bacteroidales bacterium]|nr:helix-hairpin-helix domain-containing protein [Bacteroidales bacterium]